MFSFSCIPHANTTNVHFLSTVLMVIQKQIAVLAVSHSSLLFFCVCIFSLLLLHPPLSLSSVPSLCLAKKKKKKSRLLLRNPCPLSSLSPSPVICLRVKAIFLSFILPLSLPVSVCLSVCKSCILVLYPPPLSLSRCLSVCLSVSVSV